MKFENTPTEIYFLSTLHNGYEWLSNFYRTPMVIDGKFYQNVEAYYQSQKTTDEHDRETIARQVTGIVAKRVGYKRTDKDEIRKDWDKIKEEVMLKALWHKFLQNPELTKKLRATIYWDGTNFVYPKLIEASVNDSYWGIGTGNGLNRLGELIMKVRYEMPQSFPEITGKIRAIHQEWDKFMANKTEAKEAMSCFEHDRQYIDIDFFKKIWFKGSKQTPEQMLAEHREHKPYHLTKGYKSRHKKEKHRPRNRKELKIKKQSKL